MSRPEALRARDDWVRAVWDSNLTTTQRVVALAFGHWARNGLDDVFVVPAVLQQMTGLGRTALKSAVRDLQTLGWLVCVQPARQQWTPHYALRTPATASQGAASRPSEEARVSPDDTLSGSPRDTLSQSRVSPRGTRVSPDGTRVSPDDPYISTQISSHHPAPPVAASADVLAPAATPTAGADAAAIAPADRLAIDAALRAAGVSSADLEEVIDLALMDPTTTGSVVGRIAKIPSYTDHLVRQVRSNRQHDARDDAVAARCKALRLELDAAGQLGRDALERTREALDARQGPDDFRVLRAAVHELHELLAEQPAPVSA